MSRTDICHGIHHHHSVHVSSFNSGSVGGSSEETLHGHLVGKGCPKSPSITGDLSVLLPCHSSFNALCDIADSVAYLNMVFFIVSKNIEL